MLRTLSIRDYVIVDHLELEFGPGFTVLTGETGAGKSILIDALALTLGERGDGGVVRAGCDKAELVAEFDVARVPALEQWLQQQELQGDAATCLLRRVVDQSGRSRAFINGHAATLQQMREAGELLVDIHGQHSHQSLLRVTEQRELLDAFGGLQPLAQDVSASFQAWQQLKKTRVEWEKNAQALAAERETLTFQVQELKDLNFVLEEWDALGAEHSRLSHAASLLAAAQSGLETLSESDAALLAQLNALSAQLQELAAYDPKLKDINELLGSAQVHLQEAVYGLRGYQQGLELDPERLAEIDSRIQAVHASARKFRLKPPELPAFRERMEARLAQLDSGGDPAKLKEQEQEAENRYRGAAKKLTAGRKKTAKELSEKVTAAMQTLAMAGGKFEVGLNPVADAAAYGLEQVEFLVSPHSGLAPMPLAKIASGGELSRLSLALQVTMSKVARVPTLIFDEVDAGIGGRVAEIVGKMLKNLGAERQVMCITHLPQVAACGDRQWQVAKSAANGVVLSHIAVLDREQRVEEIARMLGGVKITDTTRKHAREMLAGKT